MNLPDWTMRMASSYFTGKERDKETGYGYFSARYMDHELMTMWLSVDPMADKYPNISPYNYCHWNPVVMVDPNGMDDWKLSKNGELSWDESTKGQEIDRIVAENGNYVIVNSGVLQKDAEHGGANYGPGSEMKLDFGNDRNNAEEVFEFLADHTITENPGSEPYGVEYTLIGSSNSKDDADASRFEICTSFERNGDRQGNTRSNELLRKGLLREHTHNHPSRNISPSIPITASGSGNDYKTLNAARYWEEKLGVSYPCIFKVYCDFGQGKYREYGGKMSSSRVKKGIQYKIN